MSIYGKCGIYKIVSPSGKIYIGQSRDLGKRRSAYKNLKRSEQPQIYNSINKYGFINHSFEVIHDLPRDIEQVHINEMELFYINQYRECGFRMLNCRGDLVLGAHSSESRKKMSERRKGIKQKPETIQKRANSHRGQKRSEETRKRISESLKGKKFSAERVDRMKIAHKGKHQMSEENRRKQSERKGPLSPSWGRKVSEETKRKISEKNKGKTITAEQRAKLSASLMGKTGKFKRTPEHIEKLRQASLGRKLSPEHAAKLKAARKGIPMPKWAVLKAVEARLKNGSYKQSTYVHTINE